MKKKKIALVVDADNWAFANIARKVSKNLADYYDFRIIPIANLENNLVKGYLLASDCELIHFFWRENIIIPEWDVFQWYIRQLGGNVEAFKKTYIESKVITSAVYDHLFLDDDEEITHKIFSKCKHYYVSSQKLMDIYKNLDIKYKPKCVITDGVDFEDFYPLNLDRFNNIDDREIVIGWVGNSAWADHKEDFKGVNTILKPVLDELRSEGYPVINYFADRQERMIPHDEMVNYYSQIDLYICPSKIEGTPNPVLESMACGVPVITTDVGIVNEAFGPKQKKHILKERSKDCLKKEIIYFLEHRDQFKIISQENLKSIKKWNWEDISMKMKEFFDNALKDK